MNKIQIMILGKGETDITPVMQQLNNTAEWQVNAFTDKEDAISHFQNNTLDVVIFTPDLDEMTKNGLQKLFHFQSGDVIIFSVKANEDDIRNEVNDALHRLADSKRPQYAFVDDALKHARFNISFN